MRVIARVLRVPHGSTPRRRSRRRTRRRRRWCRRPSRHLPPPSQYWLTRVSQTPPSAPVGALRAPSTGDSLQGRVGVIEVIVMVVLFRRDFPPVEHVAHALVEGLEVATGGLDDGEEPLAVRPPKALTVVRRCWCVRECWPSYTRSVCSLPRCGMPSGSTPLISPSAKNVPPRMANTPARLAL